MGATSRREGVETGGDRATTEAVPETIWAVAQDRYGGPEVLDHRRVATPKPGADEVLVRVHAAGVNPYDWHYVRGRPAFARLSFGLRRPAPAVRGLDVAGRVVRVGRDVTEFVAGDAVYGTGDGTFAEYVVCEPSRLAPKPESLDFEAAGGVPLAAISALQALRDSGVRAGQRVLVNGASGGIGTFLVQLASAEGASVTGVCSTRNVGLVRSLGAESVVDYTESDFSRAGERYDVVFDLVGNRSLSALRRALTPEGTLVLSGGTDGKWISPLPFLAHAVVADRLSRQRIVPLQVTEERAALEALTELFDDGTLSPVLDRTYPLAAAADAIDHVKRGHARGKVVVSVRES
jgi:NADPH:quinone reductase-like Zn-dependent oxidoreductase